MRWFGKSNSPGDGDGSVDAPEIDRDSAAAAENFGQTEAVGAGLDQSSHPSEGDAQATGILRASTQSNGSESDDTDSDDTVAIENTDLGHRDFDPTEYGITERLAGEPGSSTGAPLGHIDRKNVTGVVIRAWRDELASLGGPSPLTHFVDTPRTRIELSTTHPGGLPAFINGKPSMLSNLIRDDVALKEATFAATAIAQKDIELRSVRGIEAVKLAIGLATWKNLNETFTAPVLLRQLGIRRYGRDFELKLKGPLTVNPALIRELKTQFGINLDAKALVALAGENSTFSPQPVIDRLRQMGQHIPDFQVDARIVASTFAEVGPAMLADAEYLDHTVINAVSGSSVDAEALERLSARRAVVIAQDERAPASDRLLLDADAEQDEVVAQIASGLSLLVETFPGTGGTQTIINAIGALLNQDRRVLVVGSRKASLDSVVGRLTHLGLKGIAVTPKTIRRDLIASISRNERATEPDSAGIDLALTNLRTALLDYRGALTSPRPGPDVSVLEALTRLAALTRKADGPKTRVRLSAASVASLAHGRDDVARELVRAATLGQFRYGPADSPWYGAHFSSAVEASQAHGLAKYVHSTSLPKLIAEGSALIAETPLRSFESVAELGVFIRLLKGVRKTLDSFQPQVFDRPLNDFVDATAPRREALHLSRSDRKRIRTHAEGFLRPGAPHEDLHEALKAVQQQRTLWQKYAPAGVLPNRVPVGIDDLIAQFTSVSNDLETLDGVLNGSEQHDPLVALPLRDLETIIANLAADSHVFSNLQDRITAVERFSSLGLDELLADLADRHVPETHVADELERAWWQSVVESALENDTALLSAKTSIVESAEDDFRAVDAAHAAAGGQFLAWRLATAWKVGLLDYPAEAEALRNLLRAEEANVVDLQAQCPHLLRILAPVWVMSPYEVAGLDDSSQSFDTVILVDAGATTIAENLGAIRRAGQVVAFADPVIQMPTSFETGLSEPGESVRSVSARVFHHRAPTTSGLVRGDTTVVQRLTPDGQYPGVSGLEKSDDEQKASGAEDPATIDGGLDSERTRESAFTTLSNFLPKYSLTRSYRAGGEDLAEIMNERFYGGRIVSLPWAGSFLGHESLGVHYVEGHGLPDAITGSVESLDSEVAKVVELVTSHAELRSQESLMVITASEKHATRVYQAVLAASTHKPTLQDFVLRDHAEPFAVMTLEQAVAQSRDRVVFSVGYGRTPHGKVLSDFGALSAPGGERLLAVAMTRARRSMDLVAGFKPSEIDLSKRLGGIGALADLFDRSEAISAGVADGPASDDALLVELSDRLKALGIRVSVNHRGRLALAAAFGGRAVVVESDSALANASSLRESLRLRPEVLRRLGWYYVRVHGFDLFSNLEAVAERVASILLPTSGDATDPAPVLASAETSALESAEPHSDDDGADRS